MCICIVTILIPFTGLIAHRLNLQPRVLVIVEVSVGSGLVIGKTAIKIYGFSSGIRPGVGLQGGIRATSRVQ